MWCLSDLVRECVHLDVPLSTRKCLQVHSRYTLGSAGDRQANETLEVVVDEELCGDKGQ